MCDGSHVEAGAHSMLPDGQGGSRDAVGGTQEDKKFLAVVCLSGILQEALSQI